MSTLPESGDPLVGGGSVATQGPVDLDGADLGRRAAGALGWSVLNVLIGRLGTMAIGIVLARVLGPNEFGTYAVAYVALIAVLSFNELGVSLAIVRWPGDPAAIAGTVTTISVAASTLLAVVGVVVAPSYTAAMGAPAATPVVQVLALTVIISGAIQTPTALMQRAFRQKARLVADQVGVWGGTLVSLGFALAGAGAMSLALGRVAGSLATGVIVVVLSPLRWRMGWDRSVVGPLMRFGLPLAGTSILVFFSGYADQLVVGHALGGTQLGYYVLAANLALWPLTIFSQPLRGVAPAAFARLQHDTGALRQAFGLVVELLAKTALPVCVGLSAVAGAIITLVYRPVWAPAAVALTWLALLAAVRIAHELAYDYLVVVGRSRGLLAIQVIWLAVATPASVVAAGHWGLAGVAATQFAVGVLVVLPAYLVQLRASGIRLLDLVPRVLPAAVGSAALFVSAAMIQRLPWPTWAQVVSPGVLGVALVVVLVYSRRHALRELRDLRGANDADLQVPAEAGSPQGAGARS